MELNSPVVASLGHGLVVWGRGKKSGALGVVGWAEWAGLGQGWTGRPLGALSSYSASRNAWHHDGLQS